MTLLAHVSDLHLIEDNYRARSESTRRRLEFLTFGRRKDPKARRHRVLSALRAAWETGAEHLLITGDLTEDGEACQFDVLAEVLHASPWPCSRVTLVPGNHDAYTRVDAFERALEGPLARYGATSRPGSLTVLPGAIVAPVSTVITQSYALAAGALRARDVDTLERAAELAAASGRVAVAALHHPPLGPRFRPLRWIDGLAGSERLLDLMRAHDALAVLHGHTHDAASAAVRPGGAPRIFSARAVVTPGPSVVRTYEARFGRLTPCRELAHLPLVAMAS